MATIDELKKKDGSAVQLGAGNTDPGGYLPGESIAGRMGRRASEAGAGLISGLRSVGKAANLGAPGAATGMPFNSSAGAGRGAVPAGTPIGINQSPAALALSAPAAASTLPSATPTATTLPGATPPVQPTPAVAAMGAPVAAPTPTGALPAVPSGAIRRIGNSYSGGPNIAGDITVNGAAPTGDIISAQNNQAAENLARRYGQTSGFGPAGAIRGGGTVSSMDTSAGYAADLKQLAGIEAGKVAQNADMQAQADYAQENAMRASGLGKAARELGALRLNNQTTRRDQDLQAADRGAIRKLAQDRLGLDTAKAGQDAKMEQARLGLDTNKDNRDATASGFTNRSAGRIEALQTAYESAKPEDRAAIAEQLRVMTGKERPSKYTVSRGGQVYDPKAMTMVNQPDRVFDNQSGTWIDQPGQGGQPASPVQKLPTAGEVRGGYKFKGGNPADQTSWEKV